MQETMGEWSRIQLAVLDDGWGRLVAVLDRLGPDGYEQPLTPMWNVKEMLAHLAFWEETSLPVINTIFRGGPEIPISLWYGGSDLELAPGAPWPDADTHNAREARWARSRSPAEVVERLTLARRKLKSVLVTVTDEESRGPIGEHWSGDAICRHVDRHCDQVEFRCTLSPTADPGGGR
jgi:hypothetical protein